MAIARRCPLHLILLLAGPLYAQDPSFFLPDSATPLIPSGGHALFVDGSFAYASNALTNELVLAMYNGEVLDRDLRNGVRDGLKGNNRMGVTIGLRATVLANDSLFGRPGWQATYSLSHSEVGGARFTDDVYALTFFGNADYEGRTAYLGPSGLEQQRYQQFAWGIMDLRSLSWARIALVKGQSFQHVDASTADLYTAPDGRVLDALVAGTFARSDTAPDDLMSVNGLGLGASARWNLALTPSWSKGRSWLSVGVEDLGVVRWNDRSLYLRKDTAYAYRGIAVENIFDLGLLVVDEPFIRDTLALDQAPKAQWRPLPFQVNVRFLARPWNRTALVLEAEQRYLPGFVPRISLSALHSPSRTFRWGGGLHYGGFTDLTGSVRLEAAPGEHAYVHMDLMNVLAPNASGKAFGIQAALGWRFR